MIIKRNISYLVSSFGKEIASLLTSNWLESCYLYGLYFVCRSIAIFELREIRHLIRLNDDLINK